MGVPNIFAILIIFIGILAASEGSRLDGKCSYDRDCVVDQTYCERQERCSCMMGYKPDAANERCIAGIGAVCTSDLDCSTLQYSECRQGVCGCQRTYVPHPDKSLCLPEAVMYRFPCLEDIQCQSKFGDSGTCFQDKCVCEPQSHYFDEKCVQNQGLGSRCNVTGECYINEETLNMVHCFENKCACRDAFQMQDNTCTAGGHQSFLSLAITLLSLMLVRIIA